MNNKKPDTFTTDLVKIASALTDHHAAYETYKKEGKTDLDYEQWVRNIQKKKHSYTRREPYFETIIKFLDELGYKPPTLTLDKGDLIIKLEKKKGLKNESNTAG